MRVPAKKNYRVDNDESDNYSDKIGENSTISFSKERKKNGENEKIGKTLGG